MKNGPATLENQAKITYTYSPGFLLQFKTACTQRPDNLPNLPCIKTENTPANSSIKRKKIK
ncbi:hypothetical protein [Candidatus Berkiella aquae]|uniref:Eukaryotic translation initiation factor 4G1 n=1 Tax=Candidatus Berkiella aquae TaxID=295108 RepID=A0A0Q9YBM2_9GAMM|nr:hypothetical protein [Candidatus Berkiella aquae]MCS5710293.1 hypothetical protein [Candidatus Berkiella aquae]